MATTKPKRSDKTAWLIVGIVGVFILILGSVWGTMSFGMVEGEEFSPDTFVRRKYSYLQVPLIRLQISGIDRTVTTGDLELHLTSNNIVAVRNKNNPAWHTIQASESHVPLPLGDAAILFRYIGESNAPGGISWLDWSTKNANLAAVLWPAVTDLARSELYFLIPDLMAKVAETKNATEFTAWTNQYVADQYVLVGKARAELGFLDDAKDFYKLALKYQSDHEEARKQLDELPAEAKSDESEVRDNAG